MIQSNDGNLQLYIWPRDTVALWLVNGLDLNKLEVNGFMQFQQLSFRKLYCEIEWTVDNSLEQKIEWNMIWRTTLNTKLRNDD